MRPTTMNPSASLARTPAMRRVPQPGQTLAPLASGRAQLGQLKTPESSSPIGERFGPRRALGDAAACRTCEVQN